MNMCNMNVICQVVIVMWPTVPVSDESFSQSTHGTIKCPPDAYFRNLPEIVYPGTFCLLFYGYCEFGHTTVFTYCFSPTTINYNQSTYIQWTVSSASYTPNQSVTFFSRFPQNLRALHRFMGFAVPEFTLFAPHVHRLPALVWCCWVTLNGFDQQNTMYFLCSLIQTKHENNCALLCEGWGLHAFLIRSGLFKTTPI